MSCGCSGLEDALFLDEAPAKFTESFDKVESGEWADLFQCRACRSIWAIDVWDKLQHQVAARVPNIDLWESASAEQRKRLLLRARGGVVNGSCAWDACQGLPVRGTTLCIEHLYIAGNRR